MMMLCPNRGLANCPPQLSAAANVIDYQANVVDCLEPGTRLGARTAEQYADTK